MNKSSDELLRDIDQVLDDLGSCPPAEQISGYLDRNLDEDQALEVEFHINSCARCVDLMAVLRESETSTISDPSFAERRDRERGRVAAKLGLENHTRRRPGILDRIAWLWSVKTPLFVPLGVTALLLCLFVFRGGMHPGEQEMPAAILQMGDGIFLNQEVGRSATVREEPFEVRAGEVVPLSVQIDFLEHNVGEVVRCVVSDGRGTELTSQQTVVPDDFQVVVPLRFSTAGTFTVKIYCGSEAEPIQTCTMEARLPAAGNSNPL